MLPEFLTNPKPWTYLGNNYVVVDFEVETNHGDYGAPVHRSNQLLLACWKLGSGHPRYEEYPEVLLHTWGNELGQGELLEDIAEADFIVAHRAKYELGWLRRCGLDLRKVLVFDTSLGEYVLLGNLKAGSSELGMAPMSTSLDMCCRRRGLPVKDPVVDVLIKNGVNPADIYPQWLQDRCQQDVWTTEMVFLDQRRTLSERDLLPVLYTRCLLTPVLADVEFEGMALDAEAVATEYAEASARMAVLSERMDALTGGINWRSPQQVAEFVYGKLGFDELKKNGEPIRTPGGLPKADNKTLDKLKATTDEQREFLALRKDLGKVSSLLSKNLEFFQGVCKQYGEVFFAEIHQDKTATHRLSSVGIPLMIGEKERSAQFQNTPRTLKRLFRAKRKGWLMAEPDGSQLECKTAGFLSQDPQMIADILNPDYDFHVFTAMHLFNKTEEEVKQNVKDCKAGKKDSWRQLAKPDTFKPLYGGSKGTPAQERYYAAFRARYPVLAAAQASWAAEAVKDKQYVTPWGLIYYFPTAKLSKSGYANVTTSVYNYPIQALATAEIIPIALVYLWHRIGSGPLKDKCFIVNTVHDSAPCEVHPDVKDEFIETAKQCFTHDVFNYLETVYGMDFNVPLGVGLKIGERWGVGEELSFTVTKGE